MRFTLIFILIVGFDLTSFGQIVAPHFPNGFTNNPPDERLFTFSKWPEFHLSDRFKIVYGYTPGELPKNSPYIANPDNNNINALRHGFDNTTQNYGASYWIDSLGNGSKSAQIYYGLANVPELVNFHNTGNPWGVNLTNVTQQVPSSFNCGIQFICLDWEPWDIISIYSADQDIYNAFHNNSAVPSNVNNMSVSSFAYEYRVKVREVMGHLFGQIRANQGVNGQLGLWGWRYGNNAVGANWWANQTNANWQAVINGSGVNTFYFNNNTDPKLNWGASLNYSNPAPYYFKHPESNEIWQGTHADAYVTYQLMQIELNDVHSPNTPIFPCLWQKFENFEGFYQEPLPPYIAEAQVIFPLMAGADGLYLWEGPFWNLDDCNAPWMTNAQAYCNGFSPEYQTATGYCDYVNSKATHPQQTKDPFEMMVNGLWRLSQFNHIFDANNGNCEFYKPSNAFDTYIAPVWRGVRNGDKFLIAAHNPTAPVNNPNFVTSIPVSYTLNGYDWHDTIEVIGREVYLAEFNLNPNSAPVLNAVISSNDPFNFCEPYNGFEQRSLTITNSNNQNVQNVEVNLTAYNQSGNVSFSAYSPNNIQVIDVNTNTAIPFTLAGQENWSRVKYPVFPCVSNASDALKELTIVIPQLLPNQQVKVTADVQHCFCNLDYEKTDYYFWNAWTYSIDYNDALGNPVTSIGPFENPAVNQNGYWWTDSKKVDSLEVLNEGMSFTFASQRFGGLGGDFTQFVGVQPNIKSKLAIEIPSCIGFENSDLTQSIRIFEGATAIYPTSVSLVSTSSTGTKTYEAMFPLTPNYVANDRIEMDLTTDCNSSYVCSDEDITWKMWFVWNSTCSNVTDNCWLPATNKQIFPMEVNGCLSASLVENSLVNIQVFPNPFNDQITIEQTGFVNGSFVINDITGKFIIDGSFGGNASTVVDLKTIAEGVYYITVSDERNKKTYKIIKKG